MRSGIPACLVLIVGAYLCLAQGTDPDIPKDKKPAVKKVPPPRPPVDDNIPPPPPGGVDPSEVKKLPVASPSDEQILKDAGFKSDPASLLEFFRKRTLSDDEREKVQALIQQLGDPVYRNRELASKELVSRGSIVAEMLREAIGCERLEIVRRAEQCLKRILEKDVAIEVPLAAVRLLAKQRPKASVDVLFAYLPFADNEYISEEARAILSKMAMEEGKAHPTLVAGLADKVPTRRAAAGDILARAGAKEHLPAVRKLLADPEANVRLRVSMALASMKEKEAVSVLIDVIPELSVNHAWLAEDFLFRLAEGKDAPSVAPGNDRATREKCRDAWAQWWKDNGDKIDLAKLERPDRLTGNTLIVLLDLNKVMELGPDNSVRWEVENVTFPLDAQLTGENRFLVAEYHAHRVTERNTKGEVLWEKRVTGPLVAQRLPNGNTFIVTDMTLIEVDKDNKDVFTFSFPSGEKFMKGMKLPNGEIAVLTNEARVVRLSPAGKQIHTFNVSMGARLFGGRIHMLPSGRVLIPHNHENKVVEFDSRGRAIWEVSVEQPVAATRLPNGNTVVTTMLPGRGAVEFDRAGNEVWSFRTYTRVTRAIRR